jgi:hypothetical protein
MKRHEKLIPYSHFHRKILFLALISKSNAPDVKGYPTKIESKIDFALDFYKNELSYHFLQEKTKLFDQYQHRDSEIDLLVKDLLKEREKIKLLFHQLSLERKEGILNSLGELLEKHVRKEEREFFELLQRKILE